MVAYEYICNLKYCYRRVHCPCGGRHDNGRAQQSAVLGRSSAATQVCGLQESRAGVARAAARREKFRPPAAEGSGGFLAVPDSIGFVGGGGR